VSTYGAASSAGGDKQVVGFTRPWAHAGVKLPGGTLSSPTQSPTP
jgi:hypothetical protein